MNSKKISYLFLIMLIGIFLIPMIILIHPWGFQFGWPYGFFTEIFGATNFQWIWDMMLAIDPAVDFMFYVEITALVGLAIDIALIIITIKASSNRFFVMVSSGINIAFGAVVIGVTTWYSSISTSLAFSPLGIFLPVCGGIAIYLVMKS